MSDAYVLSVANKYRINSVIDPNIQTKVINPLNRIIIQWAGSCLNNVYLSGSRLKGTAITLSSDFDLFISLKSDTDNTLKEIYESLSFSLEQAGLETRRQNVSLGINVGGNQVDLVPAKKRSGNTNYHSLYISKRNTWTQTNVVEHANIVRVSGRSTEIVLLKIWRKLHGLSFPSIYLELTVIKALKGVSRNDPANNFWILLQYLRDEFVDLIIIDPCNSANIISDDLYKYEKEAIRKQARDSLSQKYWKDIIW
ncbi:hypothetical protein ACFPVX_02520 [Cohnella faecalis]|uniref:Nucleotidyltransferase n=1 Tax=Cohnella faecalis TaxID=2315694 RepID=A0A398D076_9BACL|nr:nucleotidyltransferase [Cohnella faecalis]RIE04871.1 nucleotidyltransferase [Cohnella faecalis]